VLELRSVAAGEASQRLLVMSERARSAMQRQHGGAWHRLRASVDRVLAVPVPTIEDIGGGGVRCMLAEVPDGNA